MSTIHQDGKDFYNQDGLLIWSAPYKVGDFDINAASQARMDFSHWAKTHYGPFQWEK